MQYHNKALKHRCEEKKPKEIKKNGQKNVTGLPAAAH